MMSLAGRLRRRFPALLQQDYLPKRYPIVSTQVARTSQSASAFALGFFERAGPGAAGGGGGATNGPLAARAYPQPVAISMLPKRRDPVLRFFDMCPAYDQHEKTVERWLVS